MKKHAYLIIAHKNMDQLKRLISVLDYEQNDIFVLIDKKCRQFNPSDLKKIIKKGSLYYADRMAIIWGGYSLVEAELRLLQTARERGKYQYYHLLSGQDLPLRDQNYIHSFFSQYEGYEFLTFCGKELYEKNQPKERVQFLYLFQNLNTCLPLLDKALRKVWNICLIPFQRRIGIDRCKDLTEIGYGSNWFSITNSFAEFILDNKDDIRKTYKYSFCADELFIHTLALNSYFRDKIFIREGINDKKYDRQGSLRYINWWDGKPHIWETRDEHELMEARDRGYLFARKFDEVTDNAIINFVVNMISTESDDTELSVRL